MSDMRDKCIALEGARLATIANGLDIHMPFEVIAAQAIATVQRAAREGKLGFLYHRWTTPSSEREACEHDWETEMLPDLVFIQGAWRQILVPSCMLICSRCYEMKVGHDE